MIAQIERLLNDIHGEAKHLIANRVGVRLSGLCFPPCDFVHRHADIVIKKLHENRVDFHIATLAVMMIKPSDEHRPEIGLVLHLAAVAREGLNRHSTHCSSLSLVSPMSTDNRFRLI